MKKNNYGLIAGIGIGVVLAVGGISISQHINKNNDKRNVEIKENNQKENIAAFAKSSTKTEKKANKNQNDEVILIAEKFMNDYIDVNVKNWLDVQPVTESFRKAYNERSRALELSEALLNEEIKIGMPYQACYLIWGRPEKINETITAGKKSQQWVYKDKYAYFINNKYI